MTPDAFAEYDLAAWQDDGIVLRGPVSTRRLTDARTGSWVAVLTLTLATTQAVSPSTTFGSASRAVAPLVSRTSLDPPPIAGADEVAPGYWKGLIGRLGELPTLDESSDDELDDEPFV